MPENTQASNERPAHIRVVGGTITDIVEGDYTIYATEGKIINNAATAVVQEGQEKGVSYGKAKEGPPLTNIAKCIVNFRPHDKWNGEFGFDWIRMGDNDTGRSGDKYWYRDIVGKNRINGVVDQNDLHYGDNIVPDVAEYTKLLKEYNVLSIPWKNDFYVVPVLALMPHKEATFTLKIEIKEEPEKIIFEVDKNYYKLNKYATSKTTKGNHTLLNELKISNIKEHSQKLYLDVFAVVANHKQRVGKVELLPNSTGNIKKVNIVLVKVITPKSNFSSLDLNSRKIELKKFLNQGLIDPTFNVLNMNTTKFSSTELTKFQSIYKKYGVDSNELMDFLIDKTHSYNSNYNHSYKIYFIDDSLGTLYGRSYDIGTPEKSVIVLPSGFNDSTVAHETLHAMGLYHTFDNDSKFTFVRSETDNIMDYSDIENRMIPIIGTFVWQWKKLWRNII